MKNAISYLLIGGVNVFLLLLTLTGCEKSVSTNNTGIADNEFAIYMVANVDWQNFHTFVNIELSELELAAEPWLSLRDIDYYDFSTHYIYLKSSELFREVDATKSFVKPFVVVAGGERCYLGYFLGVSSFLPPTPQIHYPAFVPEDVIEIRKNGLEGAIDVRNDPRIRKVFMKAGKLDPGLQITLNSAVVVNRAEVITMSYSFTITNDSDNPFYVPDPDKMGSDLFHYYTNGLILTKVENPHESVWATQKSAISLEPYHKWDINWFTRLGAHASIVRTVILSGYPEFGNGVYLCRFMYDGPKLISKSGRFLNDGRIWIGEIESSAIEISIDN
jgi:hypothetical protein